MAAKLILTRSREMVNRRQLYKVLINGKEAGAIKNDSNEEYSLEPGNYVVQCKLNWMRSNEHTFELADGKNTYLKVHSGLKYIVPLYIMMFVGVFFPFYFQYSHQPMPAAASIVKMVLIFPAIFYYLYYITINRKNYLVVERDKSNPFSQ